jgi:hypothetical protein
MTEQEVQEIYNRLLELTKAGKIKWEKTGKQEFTTNFSRSSVTIEIEDEIFAPGGQVVLKIYNDAGLLIAYAAQKTGMGVVDSDVEEFELNPSDLFNLVQEKIYKYSETTENILSELRKLKAS